MFNNYEEFSEWLEISRSFDKETIQKVYKFINKFPLSDYEDYIKASKLLVAGEDIDSIITRYQKHIQSIGEKYKDSFIEVLKMEDCIEEMIQSAKEGLLKGTTTHIPEIDSCWKWRPSEFTLVTGYNADGKSLLLRYLSLIKGLKDGWKTAAFVPEDYPAVSFFDEIIMTASGYSTDKDNVNFIGETIYRKVYEQIKDYFYFVNIRPPKSTLVNILKSFIPLIENEGVTVCIIDPLIKVTRPKEYLNSDAQWAAYVTSLCVDFARRFNICLMMVLHQVTPKLQENGTYIKPDKYNIKSGGNFSDSADNVLFLQKPFAPKDNLNTLVRFGSLKIKKHRLVAIPQETMFNFDRKTNRYVTEEGEDLFDFDSELGIERLKLLFK